MRPDTWLSPYIAVWADHAGTPPVARLAKTMRAVEVEIGTTRALAALTAYLVAGHSRFGVEVFGRAWRDWDAKASGTHLSEQERRSLAASEAFIEEEG